MITTGPRIIITVEDQYPSDIQFIPPPPKSKWQSKQLHDLVKKKSAGRIITSTPIKGNSDDRFQSARSEISTVTSRAQTPTSVSSRPQTAESCRHVPKPPLTSKIRPQSAYETTEIKRNVKPAVGFAMIHRLFEIWEPQLTKSYRKPAVQGEDDRYFRRRRRRQAKAHFTMAMHFLGRSKSRSLSKASIYSNN